MDTGGLAGGPQQMEVAVEMYKNVLVPTDFSRASEVAAARARALAEQCGAKLTVIHVVDYVPPGYATPELPLAIASTDAVTGRARAYLSKWVKDNGLDGCEELLVAGSPKRQIIKAARERDVDVIVMGTQGATGIASILGSTTNAVMHSAPVDLLAVRIPEGSD